MQPPARQGLGTALGNAFQTFMHLSGTSSKTACLDSDGVALLDMRGSAGCMKAV